ncbi:hypothetical protein GCM10020229_61510 [Kitasatospora albolonga]
MSAAGVPDLEAVPAQHRDQGSGHPVVVLDEQQSHAGLPPVRLSRLFCVGYLRSIVQSARSVTARPAHAPAALRRVTGRGRIVMLKFRSDPLT